MLPHLGDYDRLETAWLPLVMYFQAPNQRLGSVSTDRFGFRVSHGPDGRAVTMDTAKTEAVSLLVGNSTSFGVGVRSDGATLASALARRTGEPWLNFSGRSFAMTQELALFQLFMADFAQIRRIVLFTGVNDLALHYRSAAYPEHFGSFFFWQTYHQAMTDAALSPNRRRLKRLLSPIFGERIDYARISPRRLVPALLGHGVRSKLAPWPGGDAARASSHVIEQADRMLAVWQALGRALGVEVHFVLQPLAQWSAKQPSPEERELFAHYDSQPRKFHQVLAHTLDVDLHRRFRGALADICHQRGLAFTDSSDVFGRDLDGRWMFSDRIHLTDAGTEIAAAALAERL